LFLGTEIIKKYAKIINKERQRNSRTYR